MRILLVLLAACVLATGARADDDQASLDFGGDAFRAGRSVMLDAPGADDVFMAGETVALRADITGSAHLAGRAITVEGAVAGDAYAAGEEITFRQPVNGDLTAAGRALTLAEIGGDARLAGSRITLTGPVGGSAMIGGERVRIDGPVAGDLRLAAESVEWGEGAEVSGSLIIFEPDEGAIEVPANVHPAAQIERRPIEEWEGLQPPDWRRAIISFLVGVLVVALIAAFIAALIPERLAEMRARVLDRPFRTFWIGFLVEAAVIGAGVLLALTLIGLLAVPAVILLALVLGFAGYVVAAYAFGVGLLILARQGAPRDLAARALAAGIGALAAGLIGLIPLLGWLFVLVLVLTGIGAITARTLRPAFFTDTT